MASQHPDLLCPPGPLRSRRAFSLIELLVVIVIIAVLAGLLLPTVGTVRDQARISQCSSNLRQCSLAVIAYAHDQDGLLPYTSSNSGSADGMWPDRTSPYLDDTYKNRRYSGNDPYHCPFAEAEIPSQWRSQDRFSFHFGMNQNIYGSYNGQQGGWSHLPWPLGQIHSDSVMLADGHIGVASGSNYFYDFVSASSFPPWQLQGSVVTQSIPTDPSHPRILLHRGRVDTSHMDGHVDSVVGTWGVIAQTAAWTR